MDFDLTDVIAVFDIGRTWKRFQLFDRSLNALHTEEKIIGELIDADGLPGDDLPALEEWMQSCLNSVTGRDLYRITDATVAGNDSSLGPLQDAVTKMIKVLPEELRPSSCHVINNTTASLIPYLRGSDRPFILASTGTWCTFMNPSHPGSTDSDMTDDGIHSVISADGKRITSSRFLLGEIHDSNVTMLDEHFGVTGELYKTIKIKHKKIEKIQANRRGRAFFRHGITEGFADHDADLSHFLTYADAYHQMMYDLVDECLGAYREVVADDDTTEIIYVTGGFARNDTFVRILAARLPEKRVYASTIENATALGAAMEVYAEAFDGALPPVYLGLKAILLRDE